MEATPGSKSFCRNYFLLNAQQASFFDLFCLLFSRDLKKRKFIDTSYPTLQLDFWYRAMILATTLLQKFLKTISTPMAAIGSTFEDFLNLMTNNGGLFGLVKNIMLGKVVLPDRTAANYVSAVGFCDPRLDLDGNLKYGDGMYHPALAIMAAKAVYNNAAYTKAIVTTNWKMEHLGFKDYWNDFLLKADTQAFLFREKSDDHETIVVSFRGTEPFDADDWISDADLSWYEFINIGKVHTGFLKALGMQKLGWPKFVIPDLTRKAPLAYYDIRDQLKDLMNKNPKAQFIVTGHSLGGALAILFPAILFYHDEKLLLERMKGVYTFGQPRVGDETFGNYMEKNLSKYGIEYYRFVYCNDLVPRVPPDNNLDWFSHFGPCVYYTSKYAAEIVDEVPYKNYFSIWAFFPMLKNAIYEIIRSFSMVRKYGEVYREGWLMFGVRLFGLALPGIPAHCPYDYVNSTRLGAPDDILFLPLHEKVKNNHELRLLIQNLVAA
ncbi:hypothetical protein DITRI_Ditri18aG0090400 [Diplodiscus trichospermus]